MSRAITYTEAEAAVVLEEALEQLATELGIVRDFRRTDTPGVPQLCHRLRAVAAEMHLLADSLQILRAGPAEPLAIKFDEDGAGYRDFFTKGRPDTSALLKRFDSDRGEVLCTRQESHPVGREMWSVHQEFSLPPPGGIAFDPNLYPKGQL